MCCMYFYLSKGYEYLFHHCGLWSTVLDKIHTKTYHSETFLHYSHNNSVSGLVSFMELLLH